MANKNILVLTRLMHNPTEGTKGVLVLNNAHMFYTMEPPWVDNKPDVSCIPAGTYKLQHNTAGDLKYFEIMDVPNRKGIEIHPANYYINTQTGKQELQGCIALGCSMPRNKFSVGDSAKACKELKALLTAPATEPATVMEIRIFDCRGA